MYNRYVPQPDGSFRRNTMPDRAPKPKPPEPPKCPPEHPQSQPPKQEKPSCPPPQQPSPSCPPPEKECKGSAGCHKNRAQSVGGFLRQLLPQNFDTTDLIIVLLLLLMAGDCAEDQNFAMLTLVLYLFL